MFRALLIQELRGKEVEVESAGLADRFGVPASQHAIECMRERGLDITDHRSRRASDLDLTTYDHIYCVEEVLAQQLTALGAPREKVEVVEINNPYGKDLETYRTCAEVLSRLAVTIAGEFDQ